MRKPLMAGAAAMVVSASLAVAGTSLNAAQSKTSDDMIGVKLAGQWRLNPDMSALPGSTPEMPALPGGPVTGGGIGGGYPGGGRGGGLGGYPGGYARGPMPESTLRERAIV